MTTKSKSQVESGRAFEYGLAIKLASVLGGNIMDDIHMKNAAGYFKRSKEQEKILASAEKAVHFLRTVENRLAGIGYQIEKSSDQTGGLGDVRDIIIRSSNMEMGISAKNRHNAVKHSRLSQKIDFGQKWFGHSCSNEYFNAINPVFNRLSTLKAERKLFKNIPDKDETIYFPILTAFKKELHKIDSENHNIPSKLIDYLIGKHDFYKIIKENGHVSIQSFNIHGTLKWGKKISKPTKIIDFDFKTGFKNTLILILDGWQISFRIHNASSRVEPSLKFDVKLMSIPPASANHIIPIY